MRISDLSSDVCSSDLIMVIQTDNGAEFQSHFHWHLGDLDIQHAYIRPRTPHLNGKVERSHRVDDQAFYQLLDRDGITDDIHLFNTKQHGRAACRERVCQYVYNSVVARPLKKKT